MKNSSIIVTPKDSIQKILNSLNSQFSYKIFFKKGVYKEKILVTSPNISFIGEDGVIIEWNDASDTPKIDNPSETYGTGGSSVLYITDSALNFYAENIIFKNSFDYFSSNFKNRQAVAVRSDADKSFFYNCKFIGNQDTLYANLGRQYYKNCYIEGHIDFIFGGAQAYFEKCNIFSKDKGLKIENGYVMAPSTLDSQDIGYLFYECEFLSNAPEKTVCLGRPWHPGKRSGHNPSAILLYCKLGNHISDKAWADMSGFKHENARFFEYNNYGPGATINENRRSLSCDKLNFFTKKNIFKNWII